MSRKDPKNRKSKSSLNSGLNPSISFIKNSNISLNDLRLNIGSDFSSYRTIANTINELPLQEGFLHASVINAIVMLKEMSKSYIDYYCQNYEPEFYSNLNAALEEQLGKDQLKDGLIQFIQEFPIGMSRSAQIDPVGFLESDPENSKSVLEGIILNWLNRNNRSISSYYSVFYNNQLDQDPAFSHIEDQIIEYVQNNALIVPETSLLDQLIKPITSRISILEQLEFWLTDKTVSDRLLSQLLTSIDFLKEEQKVRIGGSGPPDVYDYHASDPENFSIDTNWIQNLVLLVKNVFVWLHQLSEKYQTKITRLDEIPETEIQHISEQGFGGLWLIGMWERSPASKKMKQWQGNPEAMGSAYSILRYSISEELGGELAYDSFSKIAEQYGLKLTADMVPNHTGVDSDWVIEHPSWFISTSTCPFPNYSYSGVSVSGNSEIGIYIEDHYFDGTDAAVVFQRKDHVTGEVQYIYHGNDGTSMPWNDTAQLNFLKSDVREAVIDTIISIAKRFSIIRFDAAMTLTKQHFHRLWYPAPGGGGDIPSRAEFGLDRTTFDSFFPTEFWREVVDRVAQEAPNTLLLAEAFWLLEGYFVRSLGMHRVYNSAFMHLLRDEDNAKYRLILRSTLEFQPEILKRFVNYMTNPDEETAASQFGTEDKYFGICILMITLPGLPMFGHGQIEGYEEKYGMEYSRSYWQETENKLLINRHKNEVFPLLAQRKLFSSIDHFVLFDLFTSNGQVDENVFVYSNRYEQEIGLVIYHNRFGETSGWIKHSTGFRSKENGEIIQTTLGAALNITSKENIFYVYRDHTSGLEYLRTSKELHKDGLYVELKAYQYHVFLNFKEIYDETGEFQKLHQKLSGKGVRSVEDALG
ncbi:MAG: alpha-amylase family glycosyl hydrolase [Candidatus Kariarchaeaceae archaeon]|jgi:glycosidase